MKNLNAYSYRELSDLQRSLVRAKVASEMFSPESQIPHLDFWIEEVSNALAMPSNEYDRLDQATHRITIVENISIHETK